MLEEGGTGGPSSSGKNINHSTPHQELVLFLRASPPQLRSVQKNWEKTKQKQNKTKQKR